MTNTKWCHEPMKLCNEHVWLCIWCGRVEVDRRNING